MVPNPPSPTPLATIPSSAMPSRTGEMVPYTPPHTAAQQGSGPSRGPIPNTTMTYTGPNAHRISSSFQASTSNNYQADFSRFKEDLPGVLKTKLGIDMGSSRLYQKPILLSLILFLILLVGVFLSSLNLMVMILERLGNMLVSTSCSWENRVFIIDGDRFLLVFFVCPGFYFKLKSIRA